MLKYTFFLLDTFDALIGLIWVEDRIFQKNVLSVFGSSSTLFMFPVSENVSLRRSRVILLKRSTKIVPLEVNLLYSLISLLFGISVEVLFTNSFPPCFN